MAAPRLSCLSKEFKSQFDMGTGKVTDHNDLGPSAVKREYDAIDKIKTTILSLGNSFATEGDQLQQSDHSCVKKQNEQQYVLNI